MKNYQVTITNGEYLHEYQTKLFIQLHFWRFKFWYLIKTQRGNLTHICKMADHWGHMMHCEVIDKTIEQPDMGFITGGGWLRDKTAKLMASNPKPHYNIPKVVNLMKKKS